MFYANAQLVHIKYTKTSCLYPMVDC